jgi:SAM-dependent methyltransferase
MSMKRARGLYARLFPGSGRSGARRRTQMADGPLASEDEGTIEIAGVPLPSPDVVFMKKPADEAAKKGVAMVNLVAASGGNVRDGLIFDIGCGYGRFAYGLLQTGFEGRYIGMDIVEHRIDWLRENFTPRQPRYLFNFVDVKNSHYNPDGSQKETSYADILGDGRPDTIVLFSVFTHVYLEDVETHLARIAEVMSPSTRLFFSCFLFDGIASTPRPAAR